MKNNTRFSIISLGCPKNLVDSEMMAGKLIAAGHVFDETLTRETQTQHTSAQCVILNTCGFLASARDEARQHIESLVDWKQQHPAHRHIIVTGCYVQLHHSTLQTDFPEVDAWLNIVSESHITEVVAQLLAGGVGYAEPKLSNHQRKLLTLPHVAYLKIADGCNRRCAFCLIPQIRGKFVSKPIEQLVDEATELAARGVKELVVIAQETTFYGRDLPERPRLSDLIARLEEVAEIVWIRLMYTYPAGFDEGIFSLLSARGKLLPYLDMPLQHASDAVLRRMNRGTSQRQTEQLLERLRSTRDDLILRTSLIAGFPGETKAEFQELLAFVERWRFERLGVFPFSSEPGTAAATLDRHLPNETITRRAARLVKSQERWALAARTARLGQRIDVILDQPILGEDGVPLEDFFVGRSAADAPDVDPVIYVTGAGSPGDIVACELVATQGVDGIAVRL